MSRCGGPEHRCAEFGERRFRVLVEQFSQVVEIDPAELAQGDGQGVGGGGDDRRRRRGDDALAEDRSHAGQAAVEVVDFRRGHQPAIGVVGEWRDVRPAVDFPFVARLGILMVVMTVWLIGPCSG